MAFALHVEFGGAPLAQVHDVVHRIGATSPGSRTVMGLGIGMHVTLIVADTLSETVQSTLLDLVSAQPMPPFRFPSWGVFPGAKSLLLNDFPAGHHTAYSVELVETDLHLEQICFDL